ncbi:MAG: hypothetical protein ACREFN_16500 [Acetobacteraceae bacterium]
MLIIILFPWFLDPFHGIGRSQRDSAKGHIDQARFLLSSKMSLRATMKYRDVLGVRASNRGLLTGMCMWLHFNRRRL